MMVLAVVAMAMLRRVPDSGQLADKTEGENTKGISGDAVEPNVCPAGVGVADRR